MFEIETVGPCLVWKLKWWWGGHGPPDLPSGYTSAVGTTMGTKLAPPYACLSVGYLEEIILFTLAFYID